MLMLKRTRRSTDGHVVSRTTITTQSAAVRTSLATLWTSLTATTSAGATRTVPRHRSRPARLDATATYAATVHLFRRFINGTIPYCVHQAAKVVAALLRVAMVTAGLAESSDSLLPGL